jgi:hypothetical protein
MSGSTYHLTPEMLNNAYTMSLPQGTHAHGTDTLCEHHKR